MMLFVSGASSWRGLSCHGTHLRPQRRLHRQQVWQGSATGEPNRRCRTAGHPWIPVRILTAGPRGDDGNFQ